MCADKKSLLSIVKQGAYADFSSLYQNLNFEVSDTISINLSIQTIVYPVTINNNKLNFAFTEPNKISS